MSNLITVVSLGIFGPEKLTGETLQVLRTAKRLYLRTALIPCADELKSMGMVWESLDPFYERYEDFDEMHEAMADMLLNEARTNGPLVYAVIDANGDGSVRALNRGIGEKEKILVIPGISLFDLYSACCPQLCNTCSVTVIPAAEAVTTVFSQDQSYLITEADSGIRAGEIKLWMENGYDEESGIFFMTSLNGKLNCYPISALEADRQKHYDHTSAFFIPAIGFKQRTHFSFNDLNKLMDRLRAFDGCPWDREQTHESLKTYLLEETWEVLEAIDSGDPDHLADELGDLMFQIVFHASIAKDFDEFTVQDILDHICKKMIFRHSHIFGSDHCSNADEVAENWEKNKRIESGEHSTADSICNVSESLPALSYASKVLKKAEGLPWWKERFRDLLETVSRENGNNACDLIETTAGYREKHNDPELLLHETVKKLVICLERLENMANMDGNSLESLTNNELDVYLNRIKR